ncbi:hypothetical protein I3271_07180 [Photobacterium leiognathi]|uniref:hypothetical protein n=1 Tax=Photobacterium leiognathi TaxID=553611 RepID=UPI001EDE5C3F|nr:hypothetical protein [Photobacterium leiognathi]MCG3884468.1 hypothetical protein [Photobacterium leiognathi]
MDSIKKEKVLSDYFMRLAGHIDGSDSAICSDKFIVQISCNSCDIEIIDCVVPEIDEVRLSASLSLYHIVGHAISQNRIPEFRFHGVRDYLSVNYSGPWDLAESRAVDYGLIYIENQLLILAPKDLNGLRISLKLYKQAQKKSVHKLIIVSFFENMLSELHVTLTEDLMKII